MPLCSKTHKVMSYWPFSCYTIQHCRHTLSHVAMLPRFPVSVITHRITCASASPVPHDTTDMLLLLSNYYYNSAAADCQTWQLNKDDDLDCSNHHNCFTALFPGPPGWAGARRKLMDFKVQGKINRGRHTDHPAGRHSIWTKQCPPPPSPHFLQAGWPSCCSTNSVKALKANLARIDMGRKLGAVPLLGGGAGSPFAHKRHGPNIGGRLCPLFCEGELAAHLAQCGLSWSLPPYQVASWSMH